jgi:hypothetical protein
MALEYIFPPHRNLIFYYNLDDVIETILKSGVQGFLRSLHISPIYMNRWKKAVAITHQRNILEIQKSVEVFI